MAAVFAPLPEIERILKTIDGYVVIANLNSDKQAVIGGASPAVELRGGGVRQGRIQRRAVAGEPRLPHVDRRARQRAAAAGAGALAPAAGARAGRRQRERRVLSGGPGRRGPRCSTFWRGRSPRPCSSSRDCARCTRPARACSWKSVRRRRCTASWRTSSASAATCSRCSPIIRSSRTPTAFNQALCGLYAAGLGAARVRERVEPKPDPVGHTARSPARW